MKKYIRSSSELDPRFDFSFDDIEPEFWLKTTTEPARIYLEDERVIGNGAGMEYDIVIAIPHSEDNWQMESDIQENLDRHVREIIDGTDYYGNTIVTETNAYPDFANIPDDVFENSVFYKAIIEIVPYDNIGPYGDYGIDFGVEDIESSKKINCDDSVKSSTSIKCSTKDPYKVDWLKKALQNMQEDEYFIPRLNVNDNGRYIDLDEGAIQVLIDYYN